MRKVGWLSIVGIVIICIVKLDRFYTIRYNVLWLKRDRLTGLIWKMSKVALKTSRQGTVSLYLKHRNIPFNLKSGNWILQKEEKVFLLLLILLLNVSGFYHIHLVIVGPFCFLQKSTNSSVVKDEICVCFCNRSCLEHASSIIWSIVQWGPAK